MSTQPHTISVAVPETRVRAGLGLTLQALWKLFAHDLFLRRHASFQAFHQQIRRVAVSPVSPHENAIERVKAAVDEACVWYPKPALCLQRSAVIVTLLREMGVDARFVYGVQQLPFKAHAWVEVAGTVVNDKAEVQKEYCVMERL